MHTLIYRFSGFILFVGLTLSFLIACSGTSEEALLEGKIINNEVFTLMKKNCEVLTQQFTGTATQEQVSECVRNGFADDRTNKVCEKKVYEIMGQTCINVRKAVKTKLEELLSNS